MRLSKICQAKLAAAELKIQELEKSITGEMSLKPLAPPKET
jgi:exonuclease VII small subunit